MKKSNSTVILLLLIGIVMTGYHCYQSEKYMDQQEKEWKKLENETEPIN